MWTSFAHAVVANCYERYIIYDYYYYDYDYNYDYDYDYSRFSSVMWSKIKIETVQ